MNEPVVFALEFGEQRGGNDDGGSDVVLGLDLRRRGKILAGLVGAPRAVRGKSDAQVRADQLPVPELQLVAGMTIDDIDAEVMSPVFAPFGLVEALDDENDRVDVGRDRREPGVELVGVFR